MPRATHISNLWIKTLVTGLMALSLAACSSDISEKKEPEASSLSTLSFHLVRAESNSEAAMRAAEESGRVPPGAEYLPQNGGGGLIIERNSNINQDCLKSVSAGLHPVSGKPILNFAFNIECSKLFAKLTSENIGKRFAVVINDEIITTPNIRTAITGGSGFIEGRFTEAEVRDLSKKLNQTIIYNKRQ